MIYIYFMLFHSSLALGGDAALWLLKILSAGTFITPAPACFLRKENYTGQLQLLRSNTEKTNAQVHWVLCQNDLPVGKSTAHQSCLENDGVLCRSSYFPAVMSWRSDRAKPAFAASWRQRTLEIRVCDNCKIFRHCFSLHPQVYRTTKRKMVRIYDNGSPWCVCNFLNTSITKKNGMKTF